MRLSSRLSILTIISTVVPVTVLGFWAQASLSKYFFESVVVQQRITANGAALYIEGWLNSEMQVIKNYSASVSVEGYTDEENIDKLYVFSSQSSDVSIISLFESDGTQFLTPIINSGSKDDSFFTFRSQIKSTLVTIV